MTVKTLPEADEAHLVFLRRHVDQLESLLFKNTASVSLLHEVDSARNELHRFVEDRRAQGYNI